MNRIIVAMLISCILAFVAACTSRVELPAKNRGSKVYLVSIADFSLDQLGQLSDYYQHNFGVDIPILKTVAIPTSAMDSEGSWLLKSSSMKCEMHFLNVPMTRTRS